MSGAGLGRPASRWRRRAATLAVLALLVALGLPQASPFGDYGVYVLTLAAIYAITATGLTLFMGYTGQLSLGQAAFYGIGAYAAANMTKLGLPFLLALLIGAVAAALFALIVGIAALRLRGFYLAVSTLAIGLIAYEIFKNFESITGGANGFIGIPAPAIGGLALDSLSAFYYFSLLMLVGIVAVSMAMVRSPVGSMMRAIAANELGAQSVGINTYFIKTAIFTIAGAYAGLSGGLFAHLNHYISPDDFGLILSISFLIMATLGGLSSVVGGVIGAVIVTITSESLRGFPEAQPILYGAALILLVRFLPTGVAGLFERISRRVVEDRSALLAGEALATASLRGESNGSARGS
jgi:branched-chain amino acid transport system permease protein